MTDPKSGFFQFPLSQKDLEIGDTIHGPVNMSKKFHLETFAHYFVNYLNELHFKMASPKKEPFCMRTPAACLANKFCFDGVLKH